MSLVEKIDSDLKAAMKAKDSGRVSIIRMLKARLKNREIEKHESLTDDDVVSTVTSMMKQMRDSAEQYRKGDREELALKEEAEMEILKGYLPAGLSEEEVVKIIKEAIAEAGAASAADMGKVMKLVMPKVKGRADGRFVNEKVKELLGG